MSSRAAPLEPIMNQRRNPAQPTLGSSTLDDSSLGQMARRSSRAERRDKRATSFLGTSTNGQQSRRMLFLQGQEAAAVPSRQGLADSTRGNPGRLLHGHPHADHPHAVASAKAELLAQKRNARGELARQLTATDSRNGWLDSTPEQDFSALIDSDIDATAGHYTRRAQDCSAHDAWTGSGGGGGARADATRFRSAALAASTDLARLRVRREEHAGGEKEKES